MTASARALLHSCDGPPHISDRSATLLRSNTRPRRTRDGSRAGSRGCCALPQGPAESESPRETAVRPDLDRPSRETQARECCLHEAWWSRARVLAVRSQWLRRRDVAAGTRCRDPPSRVRRESEAQRRAAAPRRLDPIGQAPQRRKRVPSAPARRWRCAAARFQTSGWLRRGPPFSNTRERARNRTRRAWGCGARSPVEGVGCPPSDSIPAALARAPDTTRSAAWTAALTDSTGQLHLDSPWLRGPRSRSAARSDRAPA